MDNGLLYLAAFIKKKGKNSDLSANVRKDGWYVGHHLDDPLNKQPNSQLCDFTILRVFIRRWERRTLLLERLMLQAYPIYPCYNKQHMIYDRSLPFVALVNIIRQWLISGNNSLKCIDILRYFLFNLVPCYCSFCRFFS